MSIVQRDSGKNGLSFKSKIVFLQSIINLTKNVTLPTLQEQKKV